MLIIDFKKRLTENTQRVIQHGKVSEDYHCRNCNFSDSFEKENKAMRIAKAHSQKTGHTVDVYYESHREVTYFNKNNSCITE